MRLWRASTDEISRSFTAIFGIITARPEEFAAMKALIQPIVRGAGHPYQIGEIPIRFGGVHHVVVMLAEGTSRSATAWAESLLRRFPTINSIIMVGIAGGVPCPNLPDAHVRLGDVVVSSEWMQTQEFDFFGRKVIYRPAAPPPSSVLLSYASRLERTESKPRPWLQHVDDASRKLQARRPVEGTDILFSWAKPRRLIDHPQDPRQNPQYPRVFAGPVASWHAVVKDLKHWDELLHHFSVRAVEREDTGITDTAWNCEAEYLIVRGIGGYYNMDAGEAWRRYAAVAAAAYVRALLESIPYQIPGR